MKLLAVAALALLVTADSGALAQGAPFADPANLRGERVRPTDGRELPIDGGARGLAQMLRRLSTRASLMLIVAHPDDEDGGMLTYVSRGLGARTATLTLTRGEGGQNAMTGDFEDALGLLRTQELLAADRYLGVDQMFGTEVDFGFSKTKDEAFAKWTHERVLYDAVRAVRLFRPLVIAAVFIGGVTDGHGHHQVSGQIAQEVFKAAGDPKIFPELTREGILPWQPLKVYARVPSQSITPQGLFDYATGQYTPARFTNYVTGEVTTTEPSADVVVHEGATDPLLNDPGASNPADTNTPGSHSYVQFARIGLGLQKSQIGPGVRSAPAGAFDIAYHLYGSRVGASHNASRGASPNTAQPGAAEKSPEEASFFDGIDTSMKGIAAFAPDAPSTLGPELEIFDQETAQTATWFAQPSTRKDVALLLADMLRRVGIDLETFGKASFPEDQKANLLSELRLKRVQLNQALILALGLRLSAETDKKDVLAGATLDVTAQLTGTEATVVTQLTQTPMKPIRRVRFSVSTSAISPSSPTSADAGMTAPPVQPVPLHVAASITSAITRPYFFRRSVEEPVYQLANPALRGAPQTPPSLSVWADMVYDDGMNRVPLQLGRVVTHENQPVAFIPAASVQFTSHAQVLPLAERAATVTLRVDPPKTLVKVDLPPAWQVHPDAERNTVAPGVQQLRLVPPPGQRTALDVKAVAVLANGEVDEGYRPVGYPGLPRTNFYTPATDRIVPNDLKLSSSFRLAYLPGTGDAVPEALASIGLPVTTLSVADLTSSRLSQFDTVLLGVRTYAAHPELHGAPTQALLDFARKGGNVVLQYQTAEFTGADAPLPLTLGRDAEKVVDETAAIHLLVPHSPLLSTPNRMDATADFRGWIEERGHGFLRTWDPGYTALTEMHDPGSEAEGVQPQAPQRGGLVTVTLGEGRWTYCAFALYRQLPEAVPGAYRLLVNLLTPPSKKP